MTIKGAMIAASVAGLFAAGATGIRPARAGGEEVMCGGINACKGKGSCHGNGHSCAGMNSCKGQGWVELNKEDCAKKGGKVSEEKK